MGGTNDPNNLVKLSAREHFLCHKLLQKCTTGQHHHKLTFAINMMMNTRNVNVTSRLYEKIRMGFSQSMKVLWASSDFRERMSNKMKERWADDKYREHMITQSKDWWTKARKLDRSKQTKELWKNEEYRQRTVERIQEVARRPDVIAKKTHIGANNGMYGKTHTTEVKELLSKNAIERFKGKSYEELYGTDKANQLKQLRSKQQRKRRKNNPANGGKNSNAKRVSIKGIEFDASSEAADYFSRSRQTISTWLKTLDDCFFL